MAELLNQNFATALPTGGTARSGTLVDAPDSTGVRPSAGGETTYVWDVTPTGDWSATVTFQSYGQASAGEGGIILLDASGDGLLGFERFYSPYGPGIWDVGSDSFENGTAGSLQTGLVTFTVSYDAGTGEFTVSNGTNSATIGESSLSGFAGGDAVTQVGIYVWDGQSNSEDVRFLSIVVTDESASGPASAKDPGFIDRRIRHLWAGS